MEDLGEALSRDPQYERLLQTSDYFCCCSDFCSKDCVWNRALAMEEDHWAKKALKEESN